MIARLLLSFCLLTLPAPLVCQVATVEPEEELEPPLDPDDIRGAARSAQAAFERVRIRHAPRSIGGGGRCDEHVGRFCTTYDEGEWYPRGEAEEVVEARGALLDGLDSLQHFAPADGWILGQRVWYRGERDDWGGALAAAAACGGVDPWWCSALEGLSLHGLGRYDAALDAFRLALASMDAEQAREWRLPERAVDRDARRVLDGWEEDGSLDAGLEAFWALADPLYLVEGNDRRTAHYARWTVSEIRRGARNPYGLSWSDDLEELTVRHGWELGYDRVRSHYSASRDGATGHKHPEGRDFMPPGSVLARPEAADPADLIADHVRPRSLYAPAYAPLLLPIEAELAVFPREDGAVVLATAYLPEDTTFHSDHDHPRPWLEPGDQEAMADRIGLFAVPRGAAAPTVDARADGGEGALAAELAPGAYVLSVESWSPSRRTAGRYRRGLVVSGVTPDVATVSDLLLLRGGVAEPTSLPEALPLALLRAEVHSEDRIAIAWELSGLGFRSETLEYAVSVDRTDRNVFRRLGDFLGFTEPPRPLALSWQEPAPEEPRRQFRYLDLDLPALEVGDYRITLTLSSQGRTDVVVTKDFEVVDDKGAPTR